MLPKPGYPYDFMVPGGILYGTCDSFGPPDTAITTHCLRNPPIPDMQTL